MTERPFSAPPFPTGPEFASRPRRIQLRAAGVRVLSHQEPWLDTAGPVWELLAAVFAWVARQERERIAERVRAGLARARASGKPLGRPRRAVDLTAVRERRAQGQGWRRIARALRVPMSTLRRYSKACQNPPGELRHRPPRLARGSGEAEGGAER